MLIVREWISPANCRRSEGPLWLAWTLTNIHLGHSQSSWFRRHAAQRGLTSSHFFFRALQVMQPFRVLSRRSDIVSVGKWTSV